MKPILSLIFILVIVTASDAQVWTTVLKDKDLESVIPGHSDKQVSRVKTLPAPDIEPILRQDSIEGKILHRYGVKVPTRIIRSDGETEERDGVVIWKTSARSAGAISLGLQLSNVALPPEAKMYIYNKTGTVVSGPVTSRHIFEGVYVTDAIKGNEVIVEVIIPKESYKDFNLQVDNIIYGFRKISKHDGINIRGYDDSDDCNVDINCPAGNGWGDERDAVALILNSGGELCSGALINNACQDLSSFFLTAQHCVTGENVANWSFRFNYDSPDPTTPDCRGSEPTSWLTYSGAVIRAEDGDSDFALLELNGSVIGQQTLALAGWDRGTGTPGSTTGIHHPNGDVKKISTDSNAPTITGFDGFGAVAGTEFFEVSWNTGITAEGSSGSPLFNGTTGRIIGQLSGGTSFCNTPADPDWYGRFFTSWDGGGTDETRLSNWLGNGAATTTNTVRSPHLTGPSVVCTSNQTFTLHNPIPGLSVSWEVSPSSLFSGSTSGSGASATVRGKSGFSGQGTLTFTIATGTGCDDVTLTRSFWVGKVSTGYTSISGDYLVCPYAHAGYTANVSNHLAKSSITAYNWSSPSGWSIYYQNENELVLQAPFSFSTSYVEVDFTNACGTSSPTEVFQINQDFNCGSFISTYPNPAQQTLTVEFGNLAIPLPSELKLVDQLGRVLSNKRSPSHREIFDIADLHEGLYFLEIKREGKVQVKKIFIRR